LLNISNPAPAVAPIPSVECVPKFLSFLLNPASAVDLVPSIKNEPQFLSTQLNQDPIGDPVPSVECALSAGVEPMDIDSNPSCEPKARFERTDLELSKVPSPNGAEFCFRG
jgi:hypothetical protein